MKYTRTCMDVQKSQNNRKTKMENRIMFYSDYNLMSVIIALREMQSHPDGHSIAFDKEQLLWD